MSLAFSSVEDNNNVSWKRTAIKEDSKALLFYSSRWSGYLILCQPPVGTFRCSWIINDSTALHKSIKHGNRNEKNDSHLPSMSDRSKEGPPALQVLWFQYEGPRRCLNILWTEHPILWAENPNGLVPTTPAPQPNGDSPQRGEGRPYLCCPPPGLQQPPEA